MVSVKRLVLPKRKSPAKMRKFSEEVYLAIMDGEPKDFEIWLSEKHFPDREYAEVDLEAKEFYLNPAKPLKEFVNSFIHEFLHWQFPKKNEMTIQNLAYEVEGHLTQSEREALLKITIVRVVWDD